MIETPTLLSIFTTRYLSGGTFESMGHRSLSRCPSTTSAPGLEEGMPWLLRMLLPLQTTTTISRVCQVLSEEYRELSDLL